MASASAASTSPKAIGKIDERGYLNGFDRRGYTPPRSFLELQANILDALDEVTNAPASFKGRAYFNIEREVISLLDNGIGMDEKAAEDMFSLHRENNAHRSSRGVSGIGAKAAICILSNKTTVILFTRKRGGHYLKITVPWEEIFRLGQYTGMVKIQQMTEAERKEFQKERTSRGMLYGTEALGTTIKFQYNDTLANVILQNFVPIRNSELKNPLDRIDFVFGVSTIESYLQHYDRNEPQMLELYDYFQGSEANFYTGRSIDVIEQYRKGTEDRFIWKVSEEELLEIAVVGSGLSKEPQPCKKNTSGWRHCGNFEVTTGMRVDLGIFDPSNPRSITAERKVDSYNAKFLAESDGKLSKDAEDYLFNYKILRNSQRIGLFAPELVKVGNARANGESRLKIENIQCEIAFDPISTQDNAQDHVIGVQENKNQLNGSALPKKLTRLVEAIKAKKADQIWTYMEDLTRPPVVEEEEDEDEEDDTVITETESESEEEEEDSSDEDDQNNQNQNQNQNQGNVKTPTVPPGPPGNAVDILQILNNQSRQPRQVTGTQLMAEFVRAINVLQEDRVYTDSGTLQMYDLLTRFAL